MMNKKNIITTLFVLTGISPFLGLPNLLNTSLLFIASVIGIIVTRAATKKVVTKKAI
jgi:hypothetical protein